jgi:Phytanoyl-CoA dioxygenase (PhyH)
MEVDATVNEIFGDPRMDLEFERKGYVERPFLGPDEVRAVQELYDRLAPPIVEDFAVTILSDSFEYRWGVFTGIRSLLERRLREVLPHHRLALATFVAKCRKASQGHLALHQDWWIADNRVDRALSVWCPLVDVGMHNAPLKVVPGSHKFLNLPYPVNAAFRTTYHPKLRVLDAEFVKRLMTPAGHAVIYDQRMLHGSDGNPSEEHRVAFNCIMIPEGRRPRLYVWDEGSPEMQVFGVSEEYLCSFALPPRLRPPYPEGVTFLETVDATAPALGDPELAQLRSWQADFASNEQQRVRA